jgi:hypothetical protein
MDLKNAFIERFNLTCGEEVLTPYLFDSIEDVRQITVSGQRSHIDAAAAT